LPYQVNTENLGNKPYLFPANQILNQQIERFYSQKKQSYSTAYLGGGNMWFFDLKFMKQVLKTQISGPRITNRWVTDMESYAIALACHTYHIPFSGIYRVSISDYYAEPYLPDQVAQYFNSSFAQELSELIDQLILNPKQNHSAKITS
jgi:nucleoside phosphorylase